MTPKVKIAMEQLARMRIAGIRDGVIAAKLGYTQAGLSRIVALPEYQELEEAILTGVVSKMDEALAGNVKAMQKYFETSVPVALRTLFDTVSQRRDLRAAMSAATEILDRDPQGTFSKKKISLNEDAPAVSTAMLDALTPDADKVTQEIKDKNKTSIN
jgi:hypothetical protein